MLSKQDNEENVALRPQNALSEDPLCHEGQFVYLGMNSPFKFSIIRKVTILAILTTSYPFQNTFTLSGLSKEITNTCFNWSFVTKMR